MKPRVVAIVTAYRPDELLFETINAIRLNCDELVLIDDGSPPEYEKLFAEIESRVSLLIRVPRNQGLAYALNAAIRESRERFEPEFILTFDQDTQPASDYRERTLETYFAARDAGLNPALVCAGLNNDWTLRNLEQLSGFNIAIEALQSGFLLPVSTLDQIGDFESALFIDCVEIEYMFRARSAGMHCVVSDEARILHTVGDRIAVRVGGRQLYVFGKKLEFSYHGPLRRYYITRNRLILFRRYARRNPKWAMKQFRTETKIAFLCVVFGPNRVGQVVAFWSGVADGARGRGGRIPSRAAKRGVAKGPVTR